MYEEFFIQPIRKPIRKKKSSFSSFFSCEKKNNNICQEVWRNLCLFFPISEHELEKHATNGFFQNMSFQDITNVNILGVLSGITGYFEDTVIAPSFTGNSGYFNSITTSNEIVDGISGSTAYFSNITGTNIYSTLTNTSGITAGTGYFTTLTGTTFYSTLLNISGLSAGTG